MILVGSTLLCVPDGEIGEEEEEEEKEAGECPAYVVIEFEEVLLCSHSSHGFYTSCL